MEYGNDSDNSFEKLIDSSSSEEVKQAYEIGDDDSFFILYTGVQQENLRELFIPINQPILAC